MLAVSLKGRIRTAGIVVISSQHNGSDLAVSHHLVEFQGDGQPSHGILVEYPGPGADHQFVFGDVPDPYVIVPVLKPSCRIDTVHGSLVGLEQVIILAAQTHPAERDRNP